MNKISTKNTKDFIEKISNYHTSYTRYYIDNDIYINKKYEARA